MWTPHGSFIDPLHHDAPIVFVPQAAEDMAEAVKQLADTLDLFNDNVSELVKIVEDWRSPFLHPPGS